MPGRSPAGARPRGAYAALTTLPERMHRVQALTRRTWPSMSARIDCRLGCCHFLVLMFEWLTLWALWRFLPQKSHVCAMVGSDSSGSGDVAPAVGCRKNAVSRPGSINDRTKWDADSGGNHRSDGAWELCNSRHIRDEDRVGISAICPSGGARKVLGGARLGIGDLGRPRLR